MRLFFAFWPDEPVRSALRATAQACRVRCGGRASPVANLHATLAFLGEVDAARLPVLERLAAGLAGRGFDLQLDRLGYFRRSRIVYAAPAVIPPALAVLARDMTRSLAAAGLRVDHRDYMPHVTLVRDARTAPDAATTALPLWHVRHIVLVESTRGASAQVYRPLRRFMLDC